MRSGNLTLLGFFGSAVVILAMVVGMLALSRQQLEANRLTLHTHAVLSAVSEARSIVFDIDGGVRTYVLGGGEAFLRRYENALAELPGQMAVLRELTSDNPVQRHNLDVFEQRVNAGLSTYVRWLAVRREQGVDAAHRLAESEVPTPPGETIRYVLSEMEKEEARLLEVRQARQADATRQYWWGMGGLVTLLLLGALYALIRRREAAAEALRWAEGRFRLFAQNVRDYAIIMLDPDGHIVSWSTGARHIKGYRAGEVMGRYFSIFYTEEDIVAGKPRLLLDTAAGKGSAQEEGWRLRKDRSRFWALVVITVLRDQSGALRGYGEVTRDLTERRLAEEALHAEMEERKAAQENLREMNHTLEDRVARRTADLVASSAAPGREISVRMRTEADLMEAKQRLDGIIESAMNAIITVDERERVILYNQAAEAMFGWPRAQALGSPLVRFVP